MWAHSIKRFILCAQLVSLLFAASPGQGAETDTGILELNKLPFFYGREYFVLRSGRAQMIIQADRADLGPAFTYLLFDAQNAAQSARKGAAFNFDKQRGFAASALEVELGGFRFTALGHRTETRWVLVDGIPVVEAIWWAGGVRVAERIAALGEGVFSRSIRLDGANLAGEESIKLHLHVPAGAHERADAILMHNGDGARAAICALGTAPLRIDENKGELAVGPISIAPRSSVQCETLLFVRVPPGDKQKFIDQARAVLSTSAREERDRVKKNWTDASAVTTEDRTVQEIFDKARFGLPGMIADDGTMNAGIFEYGAQWVRDTSNTALGAIHAGHFELARGCIERMLTKMISKDGVTMIAGGFDAPDREQFDQMGELLHVLRAYRDWSGDDSLVRQHRDLLLALIERPLQPQFRDQTGMVHNRREFWERTFADAYELAYQTYVVLGLREAIELAPALGAEDRVDRWRKEADRILNSVLAHPTRALVQDGRLIKRRKVTGEVANDPADFRGFQPDVPLNSEKHHRLMPDASQALPIALGLVDGRSELAHRTLDDLEALWNARWPDGGYDRYNTSSQPDQPGPWTFATCFILRAQHEAGMFDRSRRSLEWLNTVQGGRTGAWFEEIPSIRSVQRSCGIIPWTSGEIAVFIVRHYLGVRFDGTTVVIRPALYPNSPPVGADLRFRRGRLRLQIDGSGPIVAARVNGKLMQPAADGSIHLPKDFESGTIVITTAAEKRN